MVRPFCTCAQTLLCPLGARRHPCPHHLLLNPPSAQLPQALLLRFLRPVFCPVLCAPPPPSPGVSPVNRVLPASCTRLPRFFPSHSRLLFASSFVCPIWNREGWMDVAGLLCWVSSLIRFPVNRQENKSQSSGESTSGQGLKERSPAATETPFVPGRCPVFSGRWRTAYIHFLLLERKRVSVPLPRLMSLGLGGLFLCPLGFHRSPALLGAPHLFCLQAPPNSCFCTHLLSLWD